MYSEDNREQINTENDKQVRGNHNDVYNASNMKEVNEVEKPKKSKIEHQTAVTTTIISIGAVTGGVALIVAGMFGIFSNKSSSETPSSDTSSSSKVDMIKEEIKDFNIDYDLGFKKI